jgi:predicted GH43/DUF377 family glycosyl hydrolase
MVVPQPTPFATEQPFQLHRLGTVMTPDPGNPDEAWGVLNPACCRDRAGELLLYPRVVAAHNRSRIGLARVCFRDNEPVGVERLGYALEPTEGFERNASTAGVEDPRVVYLAALDRFVMTYTAFGPLGPRVALAVSDDARIWERLGPVDFAYAPGDGTDFDLYHNKDALLFPAPVRDPHGRPALALIHRPDYTIPWETGGHTQVLPTGTAEARPSMWISYTALDAARRDVRALSRWSDHRLLATPEQPWEVAKIGGGAPPVLTPLGWLVLYHGVGTVPAATDGGSPRPPYAAGVLILDRDDPRRILYRSSAPILEPDTAAERRGTVDNVVFPTAVDARGDGRIDVYYGMADARIGVARLQIPPTLPD